MVQRAVPSGSCLTKDPHIPKQVGGADTDTSIYHSQALSVRRQNTTGSRCHSWLTCCKSLHQPPLQPQDVQGLRKCSFLSSFHAYEAGHNLRPVSCKISLASAQMCDMPLSCSEASQRMASEVVPFPAMTAQRFHSRVSGCKR